MVGITRYGATSGEHRVELEFDKRLVVMNRARLLVDGQEVDSAKVVYGDRDLRATLADGAEVVIRLHSGMNGELTRAQIERGDGRWEDMQPVTGG
ncbi:hypothetical protein [Nocardioides plantarum]|uniref:DUF4115 domain-containing protein n=1 Tax=Nocardioides plantarum TaxID=29299 RepID=A0ABV5K8A7_9ACTN|nr:hypothetical protein [Nocardioides plantarum]